MSPNTRTLEQRLSNPITNFAEGMQWARDALALSIQHATPLLMLAGLQVLVGFILSISTSGILKFVLPGLVSVAFVLAMYEILSARIKKLSSTLPTLSKTEFMTKSRLFVGFWNRDNFFTTLKMLWINSLIGYLFALIGLIAFSVLSIILLLAFDPASLANFTSEALENGQQLTYAIASALKMLRELIPIEIESVFIRFLCVGISTILMLILFVPLSCVYIGMSEIALAKVAYGKANLRTVFKDSFFEAYHRRHAILGVQTQLTFYALVVLLPMMIVAWFLVDLEVVNFITGMYTSGKVNFDNSNFFKVFAGGLFLVGAFFLIFILWNAFLVSARYLLWRQVLGKNADALTRVEN